MQIETLSSQDNKNIRLAKKVRDGRDKSLIFLEGLRLCKELVGLDQRPALLLIEEKLYASKRSELFDLLPISEDVFLIDERLSKSLADTETPQGLYALAPRPATGPYAIPASTNLVVIADRINNPSNLGAIIRTAEAAGAGALITTRDSADPLSPKSLRGSMGSALRLPLWTSASTDQVIEYCADNFLKVFCAHAGESVRYTDCDFTEPHALVIGSEASGISEKFIGRADRSIHIEMAGPVESLNAAVACAVILFEAKRQRQMLGVSMDPKL